VTVAVNGERRTLRSGLTVSDLLADLGLQVPSGIAVAVNARVVTRTAFATHALRDGDEVEIIRAVAGG
jgi:thiamine biosynthesis protein ThiS